METDSIDVAAFVAELGSRNVFEIARQNGVSIEYGSWHPITFGEFERGTNTIRVNRRAAGIELQTKIIAHELGHFFAPKVNVNRENEEAFAHRFAAALLGY